MVWLKKIEIYNQKFLKNDKFLLSVIFNIFSIVICKWKKLHRWSNHGYRGQYYKTLRTRNIQKMDIFPWKLVSSGLDKPAVVDKHTNLGKQTP